MKIKERPPTLRILNLPNLLTLFRVILIPMVIILLFFPGRKSSFLAALVFSFAAFTDWLDGYLARKRKDETNLGKFLDPLADKLLIAGALIMLVSLGRVPGWIVVIIIGREIAVTGLRVIALTDGIVIPASSSGKYKTIFQIVALIGLILHYKYFLIFKNPLFLVDLHKVGMFFLYIALIVTIWSGAEYFYHFFKGAFSQKAV